MCALTVNETKLTSGSAFLVDLSPLGNEKESKYNKEPSFCIPRRVLNCIYTLSLKEKHIYKYIYGYLRIALDLVIFRNVLVSETKTKLVRFCTKIQVKIGLIFVG